MFLTNLIDSVVNILKAAVNAAVGAGLGQNPVVQDVNVDLTKYATLEANYASDYADVAPFSHDGIAGRVLLVNASGPLAKYLGL